MLGCPSVKPLRIEVWSDVACPWCWVGKRHLEEALEDSPHEVEVTWRAFELDPSAPRELDDDVDLVERLAKKYGTTRAGAQQMIDRMTRVGTENGLEFRFDRVKPGNTFDAHRLLHFAARHGKQDAMKERLFRAYMHEGKSVADRGVLIDLAEEVGLDPDAARATLSTDAFTREVRAEEIQARELGVTGVPFFAIAGRYAVAGAQPAALLRQVIERAAEETDTEPPPEDPNAACGPDGCGRGADSL